MNAILKDQTKMAKVVITIKLMPESGEVSLEELQKKAEQAISNYGCELGKAEIEPVGFGIKALKLMFIMDESRGSTEPLEAELAKLPEVTSVQVIDVRRTLG